MRVKSLHVYPLKSGYRVDLDEAAITSTGFENDRRWMLVEPDGGFLTQRKAPRIATIRATVQEDYFTLSFADQVLELPLYPDTGDIMNAQVFESHIQVQIYPEEVNDALSAYLERPCHLVAMKKGFERKILSSKAVQDDILSFADGYPFLLASQDSLDDLNLQLDAPVPMTRFRPNIVIEGCSQPFIEDRWKKIRIGAAEFFTPKRCARCSVTMVDQETGKRSSGEPLRTLSKHHSENRAALFGMNLQHVRGSATTVRVGDLVEVLESS